MRVTDEVLAVWESLLREVEEEEDGGLTVADAIDVVRDLQDARAEVGAARLLDELMRLTTKDDVWAFVTSGRIAAEAPGE